MAEIKVEIADSEVPDGWTIAGISKPKAGEYYLTSSGSSVYKATENWRIYTIVLTPVEVPDGPFVCAGKQYELISKDSRVGFTKPTPDNCDAYVGLGGFVNMNYEQALPDVNGGRRWLLREIVPCIVYSVRCTSSLGTLQVIDSTGKHIGFFTSEEHANLVASLLNEKAKEAYESRKKPGKK